MSCGRGSDVKSAGRIKAAQSGNCPRSVKKGATACHLADESTTKMVCDVMQVGSDIITALSNSCLRSISWVMAAFSSWAGCRICRQRGSETGVMFTWSGTSGWQGGIDVFFNPLLFDVGLCILPHQPDGTT